MNPTQLLTGLLQELPPPVRRTLYTVLLLVGVALAIVSISGVDDLGPITLAQALEVYAVLSAATGGVAVANVRRQGASEPSEFNSFDEDVDLSSFEPVGLVTDVYGEVPA